MLTYSNWESVTRLSRRSRSRRLSDGLQNAFWELGGVPRRHRSDSLTAAVNNLSATREFQTRYRDLLAHYGVSGQRINVRQAHENGDAESSHGHFKTAVDQALLLARQPRLRQPRGVRDLPAGDGDDAQRRPRRIASPRSRRRCGACPMLRLSVCLKVPLPRRYAAA